MPDGTGIAFAGKTGEAEASYDIYRMRLSAEEPAIRLIVADGIQPAWSPDGQLLVFTTNRDGNLELYLADVDGRNLRNLTRHEGFDARPAWFPDGRRIASRATVSALSRSAASMWRPGKWSRSPIIP